MQIPTTEQPHDVNESEFIIGDRAQVNDIPVLATITRINNTFVWVTYDDEIQGCVATSDCKLVK